MNATRKREYDIVFLMNHYGFYKTNLYNEIAKESKILVIFLGESSTIRDNDFFKGEQRYDTEVLYKGPYEERNVRQSCFKLTKLLRSISYDLLVTMSWSTPEDILAAFVSSKKKNSLLCESSIYESSTVGLKGLIKKVVVKRHSYAFVSGTPHKKLFETLKFKGKIIVTGGVGIINRPEKKEKIPSKERRYLTIARLSPEKNLELLIDAFNEMKKPLIIVGNGPLKIQLKEKALDNIVFIDNVDNKKLNELYTNVDVFILPSIAEPWGLVVDEAIYYGTPVIVSDRVGSKIDLVEKLQTGLIFQYDSKIDLIEKVSMMEKNYDRYRANVDSLEFESLIKRQVNAFISLADS